MRYKLTIAYDGTNYCGWQVQANGLSIQSLVQQALQTILRHPLSLTGSGRTDAGVHAQGQTAHFDTETPVSLSKLRISLNALLPPDIRILDIEPTAPDFHARYSACAKEYHYHLHLDPISDPFSRLYRCHVLAPCDLARIKEAATYFLGTHDFFSFANQAHRTSAAHDSMRTLFRIDVHEQEGGARLEFEGDGFLYKMVRNLTGFLLDIGAGKRNISEITPLLASRDRRQASMASPAQGLFLMRVFYPTDTEKLGTCRAPRESASFSKG